MQGPPTGNSPNFRVAGDVAVEPRLQIASHWPSPIMPKHEKNYQERMRWVSPLMIVGLVILFILLLWNYFTKYQ